MPKSKPTDVNADRQHHLIAEAAYFRAEQRGFRDGCPIEDWLQAEQEIHRLSTQVAPLRTALVFLERDSSNSVAQD